MPSYIATHYNTHLGRQVDIWQGDAGELYVHDRLGSGQTFGYDESQFERTHRVATSAVSQAAQPPSPTNNSSRKSKSKSPSEGSRPSSQASTWAPPRISMSRLSEKKQMPPASTVINGVSGGHTWVFDLSSTDEAGRAQLISNLVEPLMDSVTQWLNAADGHRREAAMFALDNMYNNVHEFIEADDSGRDGKFLAVATDVSGKFVGLGALEMVSKSLIVIEALAGHPLSVSKSPNAPRASGGSALHAAYTAAAAQGATTLRLKAAWPELHGFYERHGFKEITPGWYECLLSAYKPCP